MNASLAESAATPPIRVLVTAGPTHEPIDSVRYLANRSSGRMGIAIAEAAAARGWATTLLLGPVFIQPTQSSPIRTIRFQTAADLQSLLERLWPEHDVLIMAAAVADYTPSLGPEAAGTAPGKLARRKENVILTLRPTPDLLAGLASLTRPGQWVIGFALEPAERLLASAADKLVRKRLDAIVANPLETMDSASVTATVLLRDGSTLTPDPGLSKTDFAKWLIEQTEARLLSRRRPS